MFSPILMSTRCRPPSAKSRPQSGAASTSHGSLASETKKDEAANATNKDEAARETLKKKSPWFMSEEEMQALNGTRKGEPKKLLKVPKPSAKKIARLKEGLIEECSNFVNNIIKGHKIQEKLEGIEEEKKYEGTIIEVVKKEMEKKKSETSLRGASSDVAAAAAWNFDRHIGQAEAHEGKYERSIMPKEVLERERAEHEREKRERAARAEAGGSGVSDPKVSDETKVSDEMSKIEEADRISRLDLRTTRGSDCSQSGTTRGSVQTKRFKNPWEQGDIKQLKLAIREYREALRLFPDDKLLKRRIQYLEKKLYATPQQKIRCVCHLLFP